jgi:hypothetical protein
VHLLHVTQTPLKPVTLVILAFCFLALVVVDAPHCSVVKEAYSLAYSSCMIFQVWAPYSSIHDGYSSLQINFCLRIARGLCVSEFVIGYLNFVYWCCVCGFFWLLF